MGKILIVDDDSMTRKILGKILTEGFEVEEAENGREALKLFHRAQQSHSPYVLAVIDLTMPFMGGKDVIRHIREYEEACDIHQLLKIIVLTSDSDKKKAMEVFSLGCDVFVQKPIRKEELLEKIAALKAV